jgi:Xaa-Pro dipeptidase
MALHFNREEFATRQANAIQQMQACGLDGLLMFKQESMFYLTGYDTFGFCFFQCLYLGADGRLMLLTRAPDLRQAENTSLIEDIRIWVDGHGANPAMQLREVLQELGCSGRKFGVEYDTYGLTAYNGMRVQAAMDGFCVLEDASDLVTSLRLIKSPAEIAFVRRAGALGDAALDEANRLAGAGVDEGEILAAMQGAVFRGGGDYAGNEFIIGSGPDALLCRYFTGRRVLDNQDQMTLEFAGAYRHYHACLMRTIVIGEASDAQRDMHDTALEALQACRDALRPGRPIGEVFDAHAKVMDRRGYNHARMNACGYSLGAVFAPIWMDTPMLYNGNPVIAAPGMVFFLHMIMMDSDKGLAMAPGETVLVTEGGNERLSAASLDLVVG